MRIGQPAKGSIELNPSDGFTLTTEESVANAGKLSVNLGRLRMYKSVCLSYGDRVERVIVCLFGGIRITPEKP